MPRIRSLKPDIWADEALGGCPVGARLLFIGLITQSDDHGRFRAAPALVRSTIFPYDESLTLRRVSEWLTALEGANLIEIYSTHGETFGVFRAWVKNQRMDNASAPLYPEPPPPKEALEKAIPDHPPPRPAETRRAPPRTAAGKDRKGEDRKGYIDAFESIFTAWLAQDALVHHKRPTRVMRSAAKKALADWPASEIIEAIGLYATVLASERHYFSHSWTLDEFLTRGVGKFAAEAQPLTRYFGPAPGGNGKQERPERDPATAHRRDVEKCRREYEIRVPDVGAEEARVEVLGMFTDSIVQEAVPV